MFFSLTNHRFGRILLSGSMFSGLQDTLSGQSTASSPGSEVIIMIQLDVHTHSISSGHGTACTIADMAKAAKKQELSLLGISDHGPATLCAGTPSYFKNLQMAPKMRCGIRMLYGVELNILDYSGRVDLEQGILSGMDYAVISMHTKNIKPGNMLENTNAYIGAMDQPKVRIVGHCDDVKFPVDYKALAEAAAAHHVMMEINNASIMPGGYRGNTIENNIQMLYQCMRYEVPVLLSSDSHGPKNVGNVKGSEILLDACREVFGFPDWLVMSYDIDRFLDYIRIDRFDRS